MATEILCMDRTYLICAAPKRETGHGNTARIKARFCPPRNRLQVMDGSMIRSAVVQCSAVLVESVLPITLRSTVSKLER